MNKEKKIGFHRRIRLGKFIKPLGDNKNKVIVVPTTTEPKFYHDESMLPEELVAVAKVKRTSNR